MGDVNRFNDGVFGIKACGQWKARQSERADQHHDGSEGNAFEQSAHAADVLFVMHGMDHRSCAQEQQGFEKGMGEQMKHTRRISACAQGGKHIAKLRTG